MNKHILSIALIGWMLPLYAPLFALETSTPIDMQTHVAADEGKEIYTNYVNKQAAYYTGNYSIETLRTLEKEALFGALNTLMGQTNAISASSYSYNALRNAYRTVDRDLNTSNYIIGFYDGSAIKGTWDYGSTWNREHVWPQSKGVTTNYPMGYDMHSVRPTSTAVNSDRGNKAYGESGSYYDPDDVHLNNSAYNATHLGSYRGDAARIMLYDYINYGKMGNSSNSLYNGAAQLLNKMGTDGVFESLTILLKWHMMDPPSLTEMVRNDGGQDFQHNRNPFIDYPELAAMMLKGQGGLTLYSITVDAVEHLEPAYTLTTRGGFVAYLCDENGNHPESVNVSGGVAEYIPEYGRLKVTNITGALTITTPTLPSTPELSDVEEVIFEPITVTKTIENGHLFIRRDQRKYNLIGQPCR